jgi:hypothetical protein
MLCIHTVNNSYRVAHNGVHVRVANAIDKQYTFTGNPYRPFALKHIRQIIFISQHVF